MKEETLKQKLQKLSEEPTPFFKSLTPFAAGYTQGFDCEKKRLVGSLLNNAEVTKDYLTKPIVVPVESNPLYMHAFIDGVVDYRKKVEHIIYTSKKGGGVNPPFFICFL